MAACKPPRGPFRTTSAGLEVTVRLQPGSSRAAIEGLAELADGRVVLKVRVGEPPEGGKANTVLTKLLAKTWKLPKSRLRIVAGHSQRLKTLLIEGDAAALRGKISARLPP